LNDFNNAQWFCEEAINICPTNSEYWNLWGAIHYYRWEKKDLPDSGNENNSGNIQELRKWFNEKKSIPDQAIYPIIVGAAQAWKKLCRSIVMGEKIEKQIVIAVTNIRNHAVLNGKMKKFTTGRLFGQALSISPDDDELYFEQGKYFFKREKWKKANKAFRRVYEDAWEISESFSYWAMYIHTNGKLLKDLKERKCPGNKDRKRCLKCKWSYECEKYTNVIKDDYRLFLGAAANHIHRMGDEGVEDKKKSAEFTLYGSFVENAFALEKIDYKHQDVEDFLKKNKEGKKIKKILSKKELKTLKRNLIEDRSGIEDAVKDSNDLFENIPAFKSWLEAQKAIAYALWILKENEKRSKKELKDAKKLLTDAIIILEKLGLSESRILRLQRHLAKLNLKLGDYPEALTAAREAARNNPFDEDIRHVLADIYILMKDYSRGIDELEASFNLGNSTPEMLKKIGDARCENGKRLFQPEKRKKEFQGAIKDYNQCLKMLMDKSQKESFLNEQEKNGKSSGADSYTEFIEDAYYEMGSTYIRLAKYDEARNHFQFAFKIAKILKHRKKKLKIRTQITKLYAKAKVQQLKKTGPVR
jgi:tetratricopeptide (TPR) repeat protein